MNTMKVKMIKQKKKTDRIRRYERITAEINRKKNRKRTNSVKLKAFQPISNSIRVISLSLRSLSPRGNNRKLKKKVNLL